MLEEKKKKKRKSVEEEPEVIIKWSYYWRLERYGPCLFIIRPTTNVSKAHVKGKGRERERRSF